MRVYLRAALLTATCGAFLYGATASQAAMIFDAGDFPADATTSLVQQISHGAPPGARCIKWTRRWNHRHGFGHRRCVQWR